jgi:hypothetical protein
MRCLATHRQENRFHAHGPLKLATSYPLINRLLAHSRGNTRAGYTAPSLARAVHKPVDGVNASEMYALV